MKRSQIDLPRSSFHGTFNLVSRGSRSPPPLPLKSVGSFFEITSGSGLFSRISGIVSGSGSGSFSGISGIVSSSGSGSGSVQVQVQVQAQAHFLVCLEYPNIFQKFRLTSLFNCTVFFSGTTPSLLTTTFILWARSNTLSIFTIIILILILILII